MKGLPATISAVLFDLDGTAIPNGSDRPLPGSRLRPELATARERIVPIAVTGRPAATALPILTLLGLQGPAIVGAGSRVLDITTGATLWGRRMNAETIDAVLATAAPYPNEILFDDEQSGEGKPGALRAPGPEGHEVLYIMRIPEPDGLALAEQLQIRAGVSAVVSPSWTRNLSDIHVTHQEATKEQAAKALLDHLHIRKEHTVGIGDGDNDLSLFKAVGYRIAMGNASPAVRKASDHICDTVQNDGLAQVIQEILKHKPQPTAADHNPGRARTRPHTAPPPKEGQRET